MMLARTARTICLAGTVVSAAQCANFGPKADPSRFFTLTPAPQIAAGPATCSVKPTAMTLSVGPITLPGYLNQQQLVTRVSPNRLAMAETDRWAEPLEDNIVRVLSQNLAALLGSDEITRYPWQGNRRPSYQLEIELLSFEADTARSAELTARWALKDVAAGQRLRLGESHFAHPATGASTEASVAALSGVLGDFSCQIAEALREVERRATASR